MGILIDNDTKVVVQGATGREGSIRTKFMKEYGMNVVAGVTPGRGGQEIHEIPIYNTVKEAARNEGDINASAIFVPAAFAKDAAIEAIDAGVELIVMPIERMPLHDILKLLNWAKKKGTKVIGPGSMGIINPQDKAALGWVGGSVDRAPKVFQPGPVGVISRSGGQSATLPYTILQRGLGNSTTVHVGTEPAIGFPMAKVLKLFEEDDDTEAVAAYGEMGGTQEEQCAELIEKGEITKPFVIHIAGAWAPEGMRFSHASSIVEKDGSGSAQNKIEKLKDAGAYVVDKPVDIAKKVKELIA